MCFRMISGKIHVPCHLGLPQSKLIDWRFFFTEMIILPTTSSPQPPPPAPAPVPSTTIIINNIIIDVCFFVFFFYFFYFFPERRTTAFQLPLASNFLESDKQHFLRLTFVPDLRIYMSDASQTPLWVLQRSRWHHIPGGSTLEISPGGEDTSFERHDFAGS